MADHELIGTPWEGSCTCGWRADLRSRWEASWGEHLARVKAREPREAGARTDG